MVSAESDAVQGPVLPGQPQIPHSFYGTIEAAGNPVSAGVPVEVHAEGVTTGLPGNPVYSREGRYGSPDPLTPRLEVQGSLSSGTQLIFFVGGVQAEVQAGGPAGTWTSSYPFSPGGVTELNLRVASMVTPVAGYQESPEPTLATTAVVTIPAGGVNPSTEMMIGLLSVLVILGIIAFYLGRRAEKAKSVQEQDAGVEEEKKRDDKN